jgi:UPF0755 protein
MFANNKSRILLGLAALLVGIGVFFYSRYFSSNVPDSLPDQGIVKIPTGSSLQDVVNILKTKHFIIDEGSFTSWAEDMKYTVPRPGRYKILAGWSNFDLVRLLQRGEQAPVKVRLNSERTLAQIAGNLGRHLETDSLTTLNTFLDQTFLDSIGFTKESLLSVFTPDTYEFYWTLTPKGFIEKQLKEYRKIWTPKRLEQAKAMSFTPAQVYTMASIVEGESSHKDERPRVAAVYLNRLAKNMKLQADPTVQFALIDAEGGTYRRLYNKDYLFAHPYNTYIHEGMPPGPIGLAEPASIDAVLNAERNGYLFFVSKPDNTGYHNFSESFEAHQVNVKLFQQWLASRK